jgi:hypothetical protein
VLTFLQRYGYFCKTADVLIVVLTPSILTNHAKGPYKDRFDALLNTKTSGSGAHQLMAAAAAAGEAKLLTSSSQAGDGGKEVPKSNSAGAFTSILITLNPKGTKQQKGVAAAQGS